MVVMYDAAVLVLRLALAVVFVANGIQKIYDWTLDGTVDKFTDMGVPFPEIAAPGVAVLEIVGGGLIGLGIATRAIAFAMATAMVAALIIVPGENGVFVGDNRYQLVLMLAAGCVAVVLLGPGSIRADLLFARDDEDEYV